MQHFGQLVTPTQVLVKRLRQIWREAMIFLLFKHLSNLKDTAGFQLQNGIISSRISAPFFGSTYASLTCTCFCMICVCLSRFPVVKERVLWLSASKKDVMPGASETKRWLMSSSQGSGTWFSSAGEYAVAACSSQFNERQSMVAQIKTLSGSSETLQRCSQWK